MPKPSDQVRSRFNDIPPGALSAPRLNVAIVPRRRGLPKALPRWIAAQLRKLAVLANARGSLNVAIVGDAEMSRLHLQYKEVAGPTDVLTFDLRETPANADLRKSPLHSPRRTLAKTIDGDVVICFDEAQRQAKARGHRLELELLLYALHGLLHLMGYDDLTERGYRRMHRREDQLLERAGLGAVFAPPKRPRKEPRTK